MDTKSVVNKYSRRLFAISVLLLTGCFGDDGTKAFNDIYVNPNNSDQLIFADQKVEIQSGGQVLTAPFTIEDDMIIIEVKKHSKEKRPEIVMRIHGEGELLSCSACAMNNLSNIWTSTTKKVSP